MNNFVCEIPITVHRAQLWDVGVRFFEGEFVRKLSMSEVARALHSTL